VSAVDFDEPPLYLIKDDKDDILVNKVLKKMVNLLFSMKKMSETGNL